MENKMKLKKNNEYKNFKKVLKIHKVRKSLKEEK